MINQKILSSFEHDLKLYPNSKVSEIHKRMGDFDLNYLRRVIYKMYDEGVIQYRDRKEENRMTGAP